MKIKSLRLENYRCFDSLDIDFADNLTVLVGINGAGKTAILDALSIFLKIYAGKYCSYPDRDYLPDANLRHGAEFVFLSCKMQDKRKNDDIIIELKRVKDSSRAEVSFKDNNGVISKFDNSSYDPEFPHCTVVYYSSKRILDDTAKNNSAKSELMYAYTNAFSPKIDFSSSLAWFIERSAQEALEAVQKKDLNYTLADLSAVRQAISLALGEYGQPFIGETPPQLFIPEKNQGGQVFRIQELSDGYRTMLALVMDLARRMAVANKHITWPAGQSVLHSPGVALIDEVELHLHPSWQQRVLPTLMDIFPNTQFIVTTHSPQVLTSIAAKSIRILKDGAVYPMSEETEAAEAGRVLEDVLGVKPRPDNAIAQKLLEYARLVYDEQWDSPEAQKLQAELENHYGGFEPRLKELELHIENSKWERGL